MDANDETFTGKGEQPLQWPPKEKLVRLFGEPDPRVQELLGNLNRTPVEEEELRYFLRLDKENGFSRRQEALFFQKASEAVAKLEAEDPFGEPVGKILMSMIELQSMLPDEMSQRMNELRNQLARTLFAICDEAMKNNSGK